MESKKAAEALDVVVSFTSPVPSLERLKLKGLLQKIPAWVGECENLVKVDLKYCQLKELVALAELRNLVQLRLKKDAFDAENLVFHEHGFPKLRILIIKDHYVMALKEVTFEQSSSPNIETIGIFHCHLEAGINGIKHLPKFKKICINNNDLGKQSSMLQEEVENHTNHPVLQIIPGSAFDPGQNLYS